jgi:hypothetical protein
MQSQNTILTGRPDSLLVSSPEEGCQVSSPVSLDEDNAKCFTLSFSAFILTTCRREE